MSLFRRAPKTQTGDDLGVLLLQGHDMIDQACQAHTRAWGLGTAERWDLDQSTGVLRFTFPDRVAEAPAQILGTYSHGSTSWLWAWANDSLLDNLCAESRRLREWGEQHGQPIFTTPRLKLTGEEAADLIALAFRICEASGFYRAPAANSHLYLTFGTVTIIDPGGKRDTVTINVG